MRDLNQLQEAIRNELACKLNSKDLEIHLAAKLNIEDFNKFLCEDKKELDKKAQNSEFKAFINDQTIINESLCTENIVGRWTWKSGDLKPGALVPWEIQVVNTLPDNFIWEKDKTNIIVIASGLYELNCGFYSKNRPSLTVFVNNEAILAYPKQ